jgi:hypothetical protein
VFGVGPFVAGVIGTSRPRTAPTVLAVAAFATCCGFATSYLIEYAQTLHRRTTLGGQWLRLMAYGYPYAVAYALWGRQGPSLSSLVVLTLVSGVFAAIFAGVLVGSARMEPRNVEPPVA